MQIYECSPQFIRYLPLKRAYPPLWETVVPFAPSPLQEAYAMQIAIQCSLCSSQVDHHYRSVGAGNCLFHLVERPQTDVDTYVGDQHYVPSLEMFFAMYPLLSALQRRYVFWQPSFPKDSQSTDLFPPVKLHSVNINGTIDRPQCWRVIEGKGRISDVARRHNC